MRIEKDSIQFEHSDIPFVAKYGLQEAMDMVYTFRHDHGNLPFLADTHQLAAALGLNRRNLFRLMRQLDRCYLTVNIPKSGGGVRVLHPPEPLLKHVQNAILRKILYALPISPHATAYAPGRQLTDNASPHVGKRYLLKMDITDFFGSIRFEQVYGAVFNTRRFPRQVGAMLTALCCHKDALPQGAPTSPALSNLVMKRFDDHMGQWCQKRGITYTRYCDDMVFSGDTPLYPAYARAKRLLEDMGFEIHEKKTRFISRGSRQGVTGLTVNDKVAVDGHYKRRLRQEVHCALKYGIEDAWLRVDGGLDTATPGRYRHRLLGQMNYVLQIEPNNRWFSEALRELRERWA